MVTVRLRLGSLPNGDLTGHPNGEVTVRSRLGRLLKNNLTVTLRVKILPNGEVTVRLQLGRLLTKQPNGDLPPRRDIIYLSEPS